MTIGLPVSPAGGIYSCPFKNSKEAHTDKYSGPHGEKPSATSAVDAFGMCHCKDDMCKDCHPENFVDNNGINLADGTRARSGGPTTMPRRPTASFLVSGGPTAMNLETMTAASEVSGGPAAMQLEDAPEHSDEEIEEVDPGCGSDEGETSESGGHTTTPLPAHAKINYKATYSNNRYLAQIADWLHWISLRPFIIDALVLQHLI